MFAVNSYYSSINVDLGGQGETEFSLTGKAKRRGSGTQKPEFDWQNLTAKSHCGPTSSSHLGIFPSHAQVPRDEGTGPRMWADSAAWVG